MLRKLLSILTVLLFLVSIFPTYTGYSGAAWVENDPNLMFNYRLELIATEIMKRFNAFGGVFIDEGLEEVQAPSRVVMIMEEDVDPLEFDGVVRYIRYMPPVEGIVIATALLNPGAVDKLRNIDGLIAVLRDVPVDFPGVLDDNLRDIIEKLNRGDLTIEELRSLNLDKISLMKEGGEKSLKDVSKDPFKIAPEELWGAPEIQPDMFFVGDLLGQNKLVMGNPLKSRYNGTGVTIAVVDTGVDFGSLSLFSWQGKVATDPATGMVINFDGDAQAIALTETRVVAYAMGTNVFINTSGTDPLIYWNIFGFIFHVPFSFFYGAPFPVDMNVTGILNPGDVAYFGFVWEFQTGLFNLPFPVLVFDSDGDGIYDSAVVDTSSFYIHELGLGMPDWDFTDEIILTETGPFTAWNDMNGDGYPDVSAGSLTWGLDLFGVVNPISGDQFSVLEPIDSEGQYAVFIYDWHGHGTQVAATAAGVDDFTGMLADTTFFFQYPVGPGIAPNASIMGIPIFYIGSVLEAWLWASGFDLVLGTEGFYPVFNYGTIYGQWVYTGNHKADIISNSWGWVGWEHLTLGWFIYGPFATALLADALSVPGYLDPLYPGTLFVISAGNEGSGAGTSGPPGHSMFAITAAASTLYSGIYPFLGLGGGYNDTIVFFSSRGVPVTGAASPDLSGVGAWGFTSAPIWLGMLFTGNGSLLDVFGGTSMAAPVISGSAAVVFQTYFDTYGVWPSPDTVKRILMNTAYDMKLPVSATGAGRVDLYRAVTYILSGQPDIYAVNTGVNFALRDVTYLLVRAALAGFGFDSPIFGNPFLFPVASSAWGEGQLYDWFALGDTVLGYPALTISDFAGTGPYQYSVSVVKPVMVFEDHVTDFVTGYDGPWLFNRTRSFVYTPWGGTYDFIRVQLTMDYETVFDDGDLLIDETNLYLYLWDWVDNGDNIIDFSELYLIDQAPFWASSSMVLVPKNVIDNLQGVLLVSVRETWNGHTHPINPQFTVSFEYWRFDPHPFIAPTSPTVTVPNGGMATVFLDITVPITEPTAEQGYVLIDDPLTPDVDYTIPFSFLLYMETSTSVGLVDQVPVEPYGRNYLSPNYVRGLFDFSTEDAGDHRAWFFQYLGDPEQRTFGIYAHALWESIYTDIDLFSVGASFMVNDKSLDTWDGYMTIKNTRAGPREEVVAVWPWPLATLLSGGAPDMIWMWNRLYDGGDNKELVLNSIRYAKLNWPNNSVVNNTVFNSYVVPGGVNVEVPLYIETGVNLTSVQFFNFQSDPDISISISPSVTGAQAFANNNTVTLNIFIPHALMQQVFNTGPVAREFNFTVTADFLPYSTIFKMKIVIEPFPLPLKTMVFTGDSVFWLDIGRFSGYIAKVWYYDFDPSTEMFVSEVGYIHKWPVRVTRVWATQDFGIVDIMIGISYNDGTMGWIPARLIVWRYSEDVWILGGINFLP